MSKVLIVHHSLRVGGGEKLTYELVSFALRNGLKPYVLIIDNYTQEYYDAVLKKMGVPVIRTRINQISKLRNPKNIVKAVVWNLKLKFFASEFAAVHIINLGTADALKESIDHKKKYYWHVGNSVQFPDGELPVSAELFKNKDATLIFVNKYQIKEIERQYGDTDIKKISFKLFIN